VHNFNTQNLLQPVITSKRPELVRSESENLEYATKTGNHKSVSLSNLLSKAAEAGQISSRQSYIKFPTDPLNSSEARDTVIFIKGCCKNHQTNGNQTNAEEERLSKNGIVVSDSNINVNNSASNREHNMHAEILLNAEDTVSYKKRLREKKKHKSSKQRKEMLELLKSLNHANDMASKLKKRSEDILDVLDTEIKEIQKRPVAT